MAVEYLGNLQDYLVNGDNYTRIEPDTGNVLTIPGGQLPGLGPVAAVGGLGNDIYQKIQPCCGFGIAVIAHDTTTDQFKVVELSSPLTFDPTLDPEIPQCENCDRASLCALAQQLSCNGPLGPLDCNTPIDLMVAGLAGTPLYQIFPEWFIELLGFDPFADTFQPDYWFIACLSAPFQFTITPPPPPPPDVCCTSYSVWEGGCCIR
jgi:hypothetical protein